VVGAPSSEIRGTVLVGGESFSCWVREKEKERELAEGWRSVGVAPVVWSVGEGMVERGGLEKKWGETSMEEKFAAEKCLSSCVLNVWFLFFFFLIKKEKKRCHVG
jgi:hypothetical protein